MLFIFWELVGLCSYLLIGFWYYKPNAASAAKKAFIVTRVGDVFENSGKILRKIQTGLARQYALIILIGLILSLLLLRILMGV